MYKLLSAEFKIKEEYAKNIIDLIDDGNTIPFIARYRKELHGSMDDQTLREFSDKLEYYRNMDKRRSEIKEHITDQGKLTDELSAKIDKAMTLSELEDIYRPFRPKRKTRASVAKERGLMPLAMEIFSQEDHFAPAVECEKYINAEKGVGSAKDAIEGAKDIIAEMVSDDAVVRRTVKNDVVKNGIIEVKANDDAAESVYAQYNDFSQSVSKLPNHRILALNRGEKEGLLKVGINVDFEAEAASVCRLNVKNGGESAKLVREACEDAYARLIYPSVEREVRADLTERASAESIKVFAGNLKQLLMQPPVKGKVVIGLDPGYRTGCKTAVVDATGKVLSTTVLYPTHSPAMIEKSMNTLIDLIEKFNVDVISIGNGTATKETEMFAAEAIKKCRRTVYYMVVSEAGASVYSASKLAAAELPELDLTLRSAVSIARRLQDPLAELVKIDPKSIGVGQYQHDMPQKRLSEALDAVVEDCVNSVGVDLNTASPALLSRVAGISAAVSKNITAYREEHGEFRSRTELKKVPKLGLKAFEQCAGFLRVTESSEPFDKTGIHPESYAAARGLLDELGYSRSEIEKGSYSDIIERLKKQSVRELTSKLGVGAPTIIDIAKELLKPGRDPRDELPAPMLRSDILGIDDLSEGMELKGTVRNVIDFGAFVDIGVHQDGLVHISQITNRFIKHPSEVLKVGDIVNVRILSIDKEKGRIGLTMKL